MAKSKGLNNYGVYCPYVTRGKGEEGNIPEDECFFVCCNTCAIKRIAAEEEMREKEEKASFSGKRNQRVSKRRNRN